MAFSKDSFLLLGLAFVVVLLISSHEVSAADTTQTKESGDHYGHDHDHGHGGGGHRGLLSEHGDGHGGHEGHGGGSGHGGGGHRGLLSEHGDGHGGHEGHGGNSGHHGGHPGHG